MFDWLSFTINRLPDKEYLLDRGTENIDTYRKQTYKYRYGLDKAVILCIPHKYSDHTNSKISLTKIIINPKNFICYDHFEAYLLSIFGDDRPELREFKISRIDMASDIEGITPETILCILRIRRITVNTFNVFKGTIYGGSNPSFRIYDKIKQIRQLIKEGKSVTEYERGLLDSYKTLTRFEVQIESTKKTLQDLINNPLLFVPYFDSLEFLKHDEETSGIMQYKYKNFTMKMRKQIKEYHDSDLLEKIKSQFITSVEEWFKSSEPF